MALAMVTLSALLFQGNTGISSGSINMASIKTWWSGNRVVGLEKESNDNGVQTKSDDNQVTRQQEQQKRMSSLGVVTCLLATAISGLAGSLSQKGLQMTGFGGRNAYLYTVEVSLYSALCLLLSKRPSLKREVMQDWNLGTILAIVCKAMGGLLTAFVHKYAGSVTKGFALILGLVLTGAIQAVLDKRTLTTNQMVGTALVLLSSWLHFTNPVA